MRSPILLLTLGTLGGCAASYMEPRLPADHPANGAAVEAPPPTRSRTLDLAAVEPVTAPAAQGGMEHMGQKMDESAEPKPTMDGAEHKHEDGGKQP